MWRIRAAPDPSYNQMEVLHLVGLFRFWKQDIPHLGVLLLPIYWKIPKATNFVGPVDEKALTEV